MTHIRLLGTLAHLAFWTMLLVMDFQKIFFGDDSNAILTEENSYQIERNYCYINEEKDKQSSNICVNKSIMFGRYSHISSSKANFDQNKSALWIFMVKVFIRIIVIFGCIIGLTQVSGPYIQRLMHQAFDLFNG